MEHIQNTLTRIKQNGYMTQQEEPQSKAVTLLESNEAKQKLTAMLTQCFQSLKVYGKEPEQFEGVVSMFNMVLADYSIEQIYAAFKFYLKHNSEMPAPADIANIIERGNRPALDRSVYISISKKDGCDRTEDDWQYLRDYERFQQTGEMKPAPPRRPSKANVITL